MMPNTKPTENPAVTIKAWVELYADSMYSWALHKTSKKEVAEDLVQDTFISALQALDKFEGRSNPQTWLKAILNNKIIDYHRRNYRNPTIGGGDIIEKMFDSDGHWRQDEAPLSWSEDTGHLLDNDEFNVVLKQCVGKLPAAAHSAIQMRYYDEKNTEDICQELGITVTNLYQHIHRAKLQLRKCLEINWFKH